MPILLARGVTGAAACGIKLAMTRSAAQYSFWYFGYPMPLAEEGVRTT